MSVVRLLLAAVVLALLFALAASVAPAAVNARAGGATYVPGSEAGGASFGTALGELDARPITAALTVSPRRLRAGELPQIRFRIRQRGVKTVHARVRIYRASTRGRARRPTLQVDAGRVAIGHTVRVRWPRSAALGAGRYVVSLHATDPTGRTLARTDRRPGQAVVTVLPAPEPEPAPAPAPDPPAPVGDGVFPVAGPYDLGGRGSVFGADRRDHLHQGHDVGAPAGTPVVAPVAGTVIAVDFQRRGAGFYVVVHGADGRDYFFAHLRRGSTAVALNQAVAAGTVLGAVGSTGASSGPHLHFEIWEGGWQRGRPIDPLPQLRAWAGRS